jgi:putative transposase
MRRTFKYKLYKARRNKRLHRQINVGGSIHNYCISLHRRYYRRYKKHLSYYRLKAHITRLKQLPKYAWWAQLGSQAIQNIVERIDKGYQRFFQNVRDRQVGKTTVRVGPPTSRNIRHAKSFTLTQAGWKLLGGNRLRIGSTVYKFAKSRDLAGTIKTVTIKRDALGDLYVYFSCIVMPQPISRVMTGKSAGFDFGLKTYFTGSDGSEKHAPQPLRKALRKLATANRRLACKQKGSANRARAKQHLARAHKRIANVRHAFHWELAHNLCATYDTIRLETLNLQGMKALWGRKVSDLGFGTFVQTLHHVAAKTGTVVQHIFRWFPSTKLCSACRLVNPHITLRDRVWTCVFCGVTHDRERNAATNINEEGASSSGEGCVRPTLSATAVDPRIPRL